jgi:hypothetical protein
VRALALPSAIGLSAIGPSGCCGRGRHCSPPPEADCNNGTDDDGSGKTDGADPACAATAPCSAEAPCAGGVDDDGDGAVHCLDCDGSGAAACPGVITIMPCMQRSVPSPARPTGSATGSTGCAGSLGSRAPPGQVAV